MIGSQVQILPRRQKGIRESCIGYVPIPSSTIGAAECSVPCHGSGHGFESRMVRLAGIVDVGYSTILVKWRNAGSIPVTGSHSRIAQWVVQRTVNAFLSRFES